MNDGGVKVKLSAKGAIGVLSFERAEKRNAMTIAMLETFPLLLRQAAESAALRVLIVTGGAGSSFSAGADIEEFQALTRDPAALRHFCAAFAAAQQAMEDFPKPAIAMISGSCIGGGCGLALGCDLRFADGSAKFGITPAKLGLDYGVADTRRLVDAVGFGRAADLLFSARLIGAETALAIGLIDRLAEPALLESETLSFAHAIAANSPTSLRAIKRHLQAIRQGVSRDDEDSRQAFIAAFEGADFAEGLAAFQQKRPPVFPS
jgi:enoyl-CoA hydratase/carnithine racemase